MLVTAFERSPAGGAIGVTIRKAPLRDPIDVFRATAGSFYARLPNENFEVAGSGVAWEVRAQGSERFQSVRDAAAILFSQLPDSQLLRLWGGFSFGDRDAGPWHPFGAAWWFLPAYQYIVHHGTAFEILVDSLWRPSSGPSPQAIAIPETTQAAWNESVAQALQTIQAGDAAKIVAARALNIPLASADPASTLERLRGSHPGALFAFQGGKYWFVTATPELLASTAAGRLQTQAVAGTLPRAPGAPEADAHLSRALLESEKDLREHRWVVQSIVAALQPLATRLHPAENPLVMRLPNLLHLATPIEAYLRPGVHHLDAVASLHPTAAVGGWPAQTARQWLSRHEPFDRGWYAAPVGWLDASGAGACWVAIRSALIRPGAATLFAGAGIVAGSRPDLEWNETESKLAALRRILTEPA